MKVVTNRRFIDVLTTMYIASDYNQTLGRIQLQKFIYLADTISLLWQVLAPKIGHETYMFGPFDEDINNAADSLAFRGFLDIVSLNIEEKRTDVLYKINPEGIKLFLSLKDTGLLTKKFDLYTALANQVNKKGWKKLRSLVYSEPEYVASKNNGWGHKFNHTSLLTNQSLRILFDFEKMTDENFTLSKENMISIFFKIIS